jgi:hypothetical protein
VRESQVVLIVLGVIVLCVLLVLRHLFRVREGKAAKLDPWRQVERAVVLWGKVPTQQLQMTVGSICTLATCTRYVLSSQHPTRGGSMIEAWEPSEMWLFFLAGLMAIATGHSWIKRTTDRDYAATKAAAKAGQPLPPAGS